MAHTRRPSTRVITSKTGASKAVQVKQHSVKKKK